MAKKAGNAGNASIPKVGGLYHHAKTGRLIEISSVYSYSIAGKEFAAASGHVINKRTKQRVKGTKCVKDRVGTVIVKGKGNFCPRISLTNLQAAA